MTKNFYRRGLAGVALAAGVAAAWMLLAGGDRPTGGSRLRVLYSGETMGELEPCNCSGHMAGGLPVRAGYVERVTEPRLLVDVGCIGDGARDFEVLRMEAALRGMAAMKYDAANLGEHELWLGRDRLMAMAACGVPLVSLNVVGADGRPVVAPHLLVRRAGLAVAVTGVVESGRYQAGPGLSVVPPREALARAMPDLRRAAGVLVVLADLDLAAARDLAEEFPEITLLLFRGRGDSHAPERINRTVVASIYGEARYLGDLALVWDGHGAVSAGGEAVLLDDRFPPSARVAEACIGWYKAAVRGRKFDLAQPGPGNERIVARRPEAGNRYVGSDACRACHEQSYKAWAAGPHSRAMESLVKVGYDASPECIVCHATGYGAPDGYVSMEETPQLGRVGCEACHGRGQVLLDAARRASGKSRGEAGCVECHTPKRHEQFNFKVDWAKIVHGEKV